MNAFGRALNLKNQQKRKNVRCYYCGNFVYVPMLSAAEGKKIMEGTTPPPEELRSEKNNLKQEKKLARGRKKEKLLEAFHSLNVTVWLYFAIFIVGILLLIWIVFVFSLEKSYKIMKTEDILKTAKYITEQWGSEDFTVDSLDQLAYNNDMCVIIQDRYGRDMYSYDVTAKSCLIHGAQGLVNLPLLRARTVESKNGIYYTELENSRYRNNMLVFGMAMGPVGDPYGYVFLNSSLEPLNSTVDIIQKQMFMITFAVMIMGFGISFFLSRLMAAPILRITRSAEKMGRGDYNIEFNGKGYTETEKLADTLNYASSEISKVDTLRRDLISNISHDLRTPLTMVKAYAEMIRDLSGDNPVKRAEHINVIIEESDRLAALVNDILDLSRLENGSMELHPEEFCINDVISGVMMRYKLLSEQQDYKFYVGDCRPVNVKADVIKIEQVLYNLINNAVNYCGDTKEIYVMQTVTGKKLRVSVTDTGPGIEKDLMPLIFDRYYRAEKHKREVIGTGLGLSIVKQILIAHGFEFGVQSELGVGSTFWFEMDMVSDVFRDDEIEVVE